MNLILEQIQAAVSVLRNGGMVVFPTETLYGLAVDALNREAIDRLVSTKGREEGKPIALIAPDRDSACQLAVSLDDYSLRLMDEHWPGPLTLILKARPELHPALLNRNGGVGVRVSSHPTAQALARGLGRPITATSANLSGRPAAARVEDLDPALLRLADMVLDGGPCPGGPGSTIVDAGSDPPRILRQGAVQI